jgi:O-antigen/teichoic acid export membrane protein
VVQEGDRKTGVETGATQGAVRSPEALLKRRLASGGAWVLGGRLVAALLVLAANALLARLLLPEELGAYFLAYSLVTVGALVGTLGLDLSVLRFVAESLALEQYDRTRRVLRVVFGLGMLGTLGAGIAYLLLGHLVGGSLFHSPALVMVTGPVAAWMAIMALQTLFAASFRGFSNLFLATVFSGLGLITSAILVVCLGLMWSLKGHTSLGTVVGLAIVSSFASVLLGGWLLRNKARTLPAGNGAESGMGLRKILSVSWPMWVTNITLFVGTQTDIWIVGAFRPQEDVAIYGAAVTLVLMGALPLQIVSAVVPPLIAELNVQGRRRELERALRATATLAGIPACLVLAVFMALGGPILGAVYGGYYREGWLILTVLSVGQLVNVGLGSGGFVLMMTGRHMLMMYITVVSGFFTVAVGLAVVGPYGLTGVAAVAAASVALQQLLAWLATKRTVGIWTHAGLGLRELGGTGWRDVSSLVKSGSVLVGEFCRRNLRRFR